MVLPQLTLVTAAYPTPSAPRCPWVCLRPPQEGRVAARGECRLYKVRAAGVEHTGRSGARLLYPSAGRVCITGQEGGEADEEYQEISEQSFALNTRMNAWKGRKAGDRGGGDGRQRRCPNCGGTHQGRCPKPAVPPEKRVCFKCGEEGHVAAKCTKSIGSNPNFKKTVGNVDDTENGLKAFFVVDNQGFTEVNKRGRGKKS